MMSISCGTVSYTHLDVYKRQVLDLLETEKAIKELKDFFQKELAAALRLTRVSAPLFVRPETGLNDNLNGVERPVAFDCLLYTSIFYYGR